MNLLNIGFGLLSVTCICLPAKAELKSAKALSYRNENSVFSAQVLDGFHFNEKAPNAIIVDGKKNSPSTITAREIKFKLPKTNNSMAFLYVCDDKLTFCETHKIDLGGGTLTNAKSKTKESDKKDENGFNVVSFAKALRSAKDFILLDFTAKWCPGCVRFNTEVFNTKAFKSASAEIYKLKVDVDRFENFDLSEKYNIKGIPTLIVADKMGHEIHRLVGFEPVVHVKEFLANAKKNPTTLHKYQDNYEYKNDEEKMIAGIRFFDAEEFDYAISLLQDLHAPPYQLLAAKVQLAKLSAEKEPKAKDKYVETLKGAIAAEPRSTRSIGWRMELIKQLEGNTKEIEVVKSEGVKVADELLSNPEAMKEALKTDSVGEFNGFDKWVVLMYKVDLLETAGTSEAELEKIYAEAAKVGTDAKIQITMRGPNLRLLIMLTGSKNWTEAEKHVAKMLKEDPNNTDLKRRQVKILLSLEKYKKAKEVAEEILNKVEGRNEFWVAESLAKALIGLKDYDSAKKVILLYLAKPEIEEQKMASVKKNLQAMLSSTNSIK